MEKETADYLDGVNRMVGLQNGFEFFPVDFSLLGRTWLSTLAHIHVDFSIQPYWATNEKGSN